MAAITTVEQAHGWHPTLTDRTSPNSTDLEIAWEAAEGYVASRARWPGMDDGAEPPAPLVLAVKLLTARYLQRVNSPEGVVGMDAEGLGAVRVPRVDVDVEALIDPWRRVVFA